MQNEPYSGKGWILYMMILGIATVSVILIQGEGGIYEKIGAFAIGGIIFFVSAFLYYLEKRVEKFNPIEEEKRLKKLKDITLQKTCIYMDSKIIMILWNLWIGGNIIVSAIIIILALTKYHNYLITGIIMLVAGIVADGVVNILFVKYYRSKNYRDVIIRNTSKYVEVDEKYTDILEDVLKHELIYRGRTLIIADTLIMADYTAIPFSWISEIHLEKSSIFAKSPTYLVCKLKSGKKATFLVGSGYTAMYIRKVWECQKIERFLDEDYRMNRLGIFYC